MKAPLPETVEAGRVLDGPRRSAPGASFGAFSLRPRGCRRLWVVMSTEEGWEHVSVSLMDQPTRAPAWHEMDAVKRLFFAPDETVMQLHPPEAEHISPGTSFGVEVLHLWRPSTAAIPMPPAWMV